MKTLENYTIVKETEKALLIKAFISELEKEVEFWLPKSKTEKKMRAWKLTPKLGKPK